MGAIRENGEWLERTKADSHIKSSDIIQPTDLQTRYSETIQTHSAVSVAASGISASSWFDAEGFDKLGITLLNDANTSSSLNINWSNDGVNVHGDDSVLGSATSRYRSTDATIKARYFRFQVINGDSVAHTMSAWAYLKV